MGRSLREMKPGSKGVVERIIGSGAVKRRLMDMGITSGTSIEVRKVAPFGDPIEVNIRGYELSFRKAEAESIIIRQ